MQEFLAGDTNDARRLPKAAQSRREESGKLQQTPSSGSTLPKSEIMNSIAKIILVGLVFVVPAGLSQAAPVAENWGNHCQKCHGADGKGQTKVGKRLKVKDYTDANVQAEMTDEDIIRITTEGVKDENGKEKMKGFGDELSAEEIKEFVAFIRAFKG